MDPDHNPTRGASGGIYHERVVFLCREHHVEKGTIGVHTFQAKYNLDFEAAQTLTRATWERLVEQGEERGDD